MAGRRLILDSGALSALAAGEPRLVAWVYRATERQMRIGIPAPVLAETLTGQPGDASVHRVLAGGNTVLDTTAGIAAEAGALRYRAARPDLTVDALIIATAADYPGSIVLTSDPDDLSRLAAESPRVKLRVRSINAPRAS